MNHVALLVLGSAFVSDRVDDRGLDDRSIRSLSPLVGNLAQKTAAKSLQPIGARCVRVESRCDRKRSGPASGSPADLSIRQARRASQQLLNEVSAARICLLDQALKAAYDKQLWGEFEATGGKKRFVSDIYPRGTTGHIDGSSLVQHHYRADQGEQLHVLTPRPRLFVPVRPAEDIAIHHTLGPPSVVPIPDAYPLGTRCRSVVVCHTCGFSLTPQEGEPRFLCVAKRPSLQNAPPCPSRDASPGAIKRDRSKFSGQGCRCQL